MSQEVFEGDKYLNFTATVAAGPTSGNLLGILVASSSSGTIKLATASRTIVNTMSVTAGQFYPVPCRYHGALVITVGGTLDATLFYRQ
jgi:hypothetical protein